MTTREQSGVLCAGDANARASADITWQYHQAHIYCRTWSSRHQYWQATVVSQKRPWVKPPPVPALALRMTLRSVSTQA